MKKIIIAIFLLINIVNAQVSVDRSRAILQGTTKSQSIKLTNEGSLPYLAQAWVENEKGQKISTPIAALPILQRINPKQSKQVRLSVIGNAAAELPTDRESMLFLTVLGVPSTNNADVNSIGVALQTKIKLFYRPDGLTPYENNGWAKELTMNKSGNSMTINNPTAYHVVIYRFSNANSRKIIERDIVLKPFSSESVNVSLSNKFAILTINDFGGTDSL
ncbi:molecular chaperone [Ignatzschineria rhizosphaerae]|uniref:Molecular chaperone n=1 Tax=Ignatzschineria rhizosphaerae TaxID=2923279 RepID=A0ABY3WZI1_9GAMM|nr:molecular chaperone [Ignatzschineria rhizosphaerae]UNM96026.1 molecular chaperone [Ignatzschineria rhizosphaerae]